jgi:hypothetical protein
MYDHSLFRFRSISGLLSTRNNRCFVDRLTQAPDLVGVGRGKQGIMDIVRLLMRKHYLSPYKCRTPFLTADVDVGTNVYVHNFLRETLLGRN